MTAPTILASMSVAERQELRSAIPAAALFEELVRRAWLLTVIAHERAPQCTMRYADVVIPAVEFFHRDLRDIVNRAVAAGVLDESHPMAVEFDPTAPAEDDT